MLEIFTFSCISHIWWEGLPRKRKPEKQRHSQETSHLQCFVQFLLWVSSPSPDVPSLPPSSSLQCHLRWHPCSPSQLCWSPTFKVFHPSIPFFPVKTRPVDKITLTDLRGLTFFVMLFIFNFPGEGQSWWRESSLAWSSSLLSCVKRNGEKYVQGSFRMACPQGWAGMTARWTTRAQSWAWNKVQACPKSSHLQDRTRRYSSSWIKIPKKEKDFFHQAWQLDGWGRGH